MTITSKPKSSPTSLVVDEVTFEAIRQQALAVVTRALTAQAWAVACALFCEPGEGQSFDFIGHGYSGQGKTRRIGSLSAPADLAVEIFS